MKKFLTVLAFLCVFLTVFAACSPSNIAPIADVIASSTHAPTAVAITLSPTGQQPIPASAASATAVTTPPLSTPTREPATSVATPTPFAPPMTEALTFKLLHQQGGLINSVAVVGQTAFVGSGSRLVVVDITDTAVPQTLGQSDILPGLVTAVLVRDGRAYVGAGSSVLTFDISDPGAPVLLGELFLSERIEHLALQAETLIAAAAAGPSAAHEIGSGKLFTVDVSQPEHPQLLDSADLPWDIHAIALANNIVYANHPADATFYALDISIPDNLPDPVPFPGATLTYSLQARDQTLYMGGGRSDISAWDVSDLKQPQKLWEVLAEPDPDFGLGVVNGFVFAEDSVYLDAVSYDGQIIGPLALPLPEPMENNSGELVSSGIVIQGDQLVVGSTSLNLYTGGDREKIALKTRYQGPGLSPGPRDIAFAGENGLVVSRNDGIENKSSDLTIVQLPELNFLGKFINETACVGCQGTLADIGLAGNVAYVTEGGNLYAIDISQPTQPTLAATYTAADFDAGWRILYELSVVAGRGYAVGYASNRAVLVEFDLSDPHDVQATKIYWQGHTEHVTAEADSLYLSNYASDQQTFELHRFTLAGEEPQLTGAVAVANDVYDIVLDGDVALIGTDAGLIVVSADAATGLPMVTTQLQIPGGLWELVLVDDLLLATTAESFGSGRLLTIDLQDPNQPRVMGTALLPSGKAELAVSHEGSILVGNPAMGLMVFAMVK
ncbi:MAG: hypothetical protein KDE48_21290 [Anaerolineales bacterium]|nr:hypothetical protein [Anaerolineales bacterium]